MRKIDGYIFHIISGEQAVETATKDNKYDNLVNTTKLFSQYNKKYSDNNKYISVS